MGGRRCGNIIPSPYGSAGAHASAYLRTAGGDALTLVEIYLPAGRAIVRVSLYECLCNGFADLLEDQTPDFY
jgi:hypothetical protein